MQNRNYVTKSMAYVLMSLFLLLGFGANKSLAQSTDADTQAASGRWFIKPYDYDSSSVWYGSFSWASTANITWTLPTYSADGFALSTFPLPFSEPKFTVSGVNISARDFTGYAVNRLGPLGSRAMSSGAGTSTTGVVFYGATWAVTATGIGTYDVHAVATDPWNIFPSDTAGIPGSTYSVYIPFSMLAGHRDTSGGTITSGYRYDVNYATASGLTTLLSVNVDLVSTTVTTSSAFGSQLMFFQQSSMDSVPSGASTPGVMLTTAQLESLILSNINASGTLTSPIHLGVVLSGIPVPTTPFTDGAVAQVGVSISAFESAAIPEPAAIWLASCGIAVGLGTYAWRRRIRFRKRSRNWVM